MTDPGAALVISILNDWRREQSADMAHLKSEMAAVKCDVAELKANQLSPEVTQFITNAAGTARWTWKRRSLVPVGIIGVIAASVHEQIVRLLGGLR